MWHGLGAAPPPYGVRRAGGGGNSGVSRVHAAGRVVLSLCVSLSTLPHLHTRTSTPHVTVVFTAAVAAISCQLTTIAAAASSAAPAAATITPSPPPPPAAAAAFHPYQHTLHSPSVATAQPDSQPNISSTALTLPHLITTGAESCPLPCHHPLGVSSSRPPASSAHRRSPRHQILLQTHLPTPPKFSRQLNNPRPSSPTSHLLRIPSTTSPPIWKSHTSTSW